LSFAQKDSLIPIFVYPTKGINNNNRFGIEKALKNHGNPKALSKINKIPLKHVFYSFICAISSFFTSNIL